MAEDSLEELVLSIYGYWGLNSGCPAWQHCLCLLSHCTGPIYPSVLTYVGMGNRRDADLGEGEKARPGLELFGVGAPLALERV